jgi:hypothetical protein
VVVVVLVFGEEYSIDCIDLRIAVCS